MTTGRTLAQADGTVVAIDRIRCDGHGMCAELLPELIALDDWGYPIVAAGRVPDAFFELARRAVAVCPVVAFQLRAATSAPMPSPRRQEAPG